MRVFLYLFLCVCVTLQIFSHSAHAEGIAVAELYTSNGCVGAVEAGVIFEELAEIQDDDLILLSCHVTSFDDEEWKDRFSSPYCDERHEQYQKLSGVFDGNSVPYVVVNGRVVNRADRTGAVKASLQMSQAMDGVVPLHLERRDGVLDITLPKIRHEGDMAVWLFAYDERYAFYAPEDLMGVEVNGVNINAAKYIKPLMDWQGDYKSMSLPVEKLEAQGFVVLVQDKSTQTVVAVGRSVL